ncbi:hypothetical protein [Kosakonia cowanii]|nr:hypothetical protein [Kosakonia cowanii]
MLKGMLIAGWRVNAYPAYGVTLELYGHCRMARKRLSGLRNNAETVW